MAWIFSESAHLLLLNYTMISMSNYTAWWLSVTLESDRWGSETTTQPRPILYISFLTMTSTKVVIQFKHENIKCIT